MEDEPERGRDAIETSSRGWGAPGSTPEAATRLSPEASTEHSSSSATAARWKNNQPAQEAAVSVNRRSGAAGAVSEPPPAGLPVRAPRNAAVARPNANGHDHGHAEASGQPQEPDEPQEPQQEILAATSSSIPSSTPSTSCKNLLGQNRKEKQEHNVEDEDPLIHGRDQAEQLSDRGHDPRSPRPSSATKAKVLSVDGPKAKSGHNSGSTTSHTTTFDNDNCANVCRAFGVRSLSELRWSHGCNTRRQLRDVLRQETTDVVEVDVTIGKLLRDGREKAVFDFSFFNCVGARQKQDQEIDLGGRGPGGYSGNNGRRGTAGNNLYTTSTTASSANQNLESGGSNFQHQFGIAANEQLILCHFPYTKSDLSLEEFLRVLCDQNDHAKRLQERAAAATAAAGAAEERHQHVLQEDRRDEVNTSKSLGATFFAAEEITDAAPARPSSSCTAPAPSTSATSLSPEVVGEVSVLCSASTSFPAGAADAFYLDTAGSSGRSSATASSSSFLHVVPRSPIRTTTTTEVAVGAGTGIGSLSATERSGTEDESGAVTAATTSGSGANEGSDRGRRNHHVDQNQTTFRSPGVGSGTWINQNPDRRESSGASSSSTSGATPGDRISREQSESTTTTSSASAQDHVTFLFHQERTTGTAELAGTDNSSCAPPPPPSLVGMKSAATVRKRLARGDVGEEDEDQDRDRRQHSRTAWESLSPQQRDTITRNGNSTTAEVLSSGSSRSPEQVARRAGPGRRNRTNYRPLGVKLDFKTLRAVRPAVELLRRLNALERLPVVILNADIFHGPCSLSERYLPVLDPARFLQYAAGAGPRAVLSLSWLAGDHAISSKNRQYTDQMIEQMLQLVLFPLIDDGSGLVRSPANAIPHITFAICAQYAAASKKVLDRLLQNIPSASFTLFSGSWSRGISREQYRNLRRMFPPARTFFDVRLQDEKGGKAT